MKKHIVSKFSSGITLLFLISSCTSTSPSETPQVPTLASTFLSTSTITPTTPATLDVATPINTMTSEEQKDFFINFLSDSGDCYLPCWWNITPGQTWENAEKRIHNVGGSLIEVFPGYDAATTVYLVGIDALPINNLYLEEKQGVVYAWHVSSTGGVSDPDKFGKSWENYSAQKVIIRYGRPNRILLNSEPSFNSLEYGLYSLWLFYDELSFSIAYNARIPIQYANSAHFNICPNSDPLLNIEMHMQSQDNLLPLDRFDRILEEVRLGTDIGKLIVVRSLQEATELSNDEELYQVYIQEKNPCFAIPSDIWTAE